MKNLVVLLFLLSSVYLTGVYSALGFPFDIPNLKASVSSAIGSGVSPLEAVKTAAAATAHLDRTDAIEKIQKIVKTVSEPLRDLLSKLRHISSSKSTEGNILQDVASLIKKATREIEEAAKETDHLDKKLRPSVQNEIVNSLSYLKFTIDTLEREGHDVKRALDHATRAQPAVTAATISYYVTPALVNRLASTIASIVSGINRLAVALQNALATRNAAINYQQSVKQSVTVSRNSINSQLTSWNKLIDTTRISIDQTSESIARVVKATFDPIVTKPSDWNKANIEPLITYLAQYDYLQEGFIKMFDEGLRFVEKSAKTIVHEKTSKLSQTLHEASAEISDSGSTSDSAYADSCVSKHIGTLLSAPTSINRLGECFQAETSYVTTVETTTKLTLGQEKDNAVKKMAQLQKCVLKNGPCVQTLFETLTFESSQSTYVGLVYGLYNLYFSAQRIGDCMEATSDDIEALAHKIEHQFKHCLVTGTYQGVRLIQDDE